MYSHYSEYHDSRKKTITNFGKNFRHNYKSATVTQKCLSGFLANFTIFYIQSIFTVYNFFNVIVILNEKINLQIHHPTHMSVHVGGSLYPI